MKCNKCGMELSNDTKFCPSCGTKVVECCPKCGKEIKESAKFCDNCGYCLSGENGTESKSGIVNTEIYNTDISKDEPVKVTVRPEVKSQGRFRTVDDFKIELEELADRDHDTKSCMVFHGKKAFYKYLYPYLLNDEQVLTVCHIQSKWWLARYRTEFVAITNLRVIKIEKLQYFSPKVESCYLGDIQEIKADNPSNAVSGTFIGEKMDIIYSGGHIKLRTCGKGAATALKGRIIVEKDKYKSAGVTYRSSATNYKITSAKIDNTGSNKGQYIIGGVILIAATGVLIGLVEATKNTDLIKQSNMVIEGTSANDVTSGETQKTILANSFDNYSDEYILPESSERIYTSAELENLSKEKLRLARNEIYAKHGRKYVTADLNEYFNSRPWYKGYLSAEQFDDSVFNDYEKYNIDLIKSVESGTNSTNTGAALGWVGAYSSEDGQNITINSSDIDGLDVSFSGYSEEGWYTENMRLTYTNSSRNQALCGEGKSEVVFTLFSDGIDVDILPSGGWKEGVYYRN